MTDSNNSSLSYEQKVAALRYFLEDGKLVHLHASAPQQHKDSFVKQLVTTLLSDTDLCKKAIGTKARITLFPDKSLPDSISSYVLDTEDLGIQINIPMQSDNLSHVIADALNAAIRKREDILAAHEPSMPLSRTALQSVPLDGELSSGHAYITRPFGDYGTYDPKQNDLYSSKVFRHTGSQLWEKGKARVGNQDASARWLWEQDHAYVLSDEALKTKTPGRWFRDLCVVCGVSSNTLEQLAGIARPTWTRIQNDKKLSRDAFIKALTVVLKSPVHVGKGRGYTLPAGSLFGLPTIQLKHPNGSMETIVDPAVLDRISMALFNEHYEAATTDKSAEFELKRLEHISSAYICGAIPASELLQHGIPAKPIANLMKAHGLNAKYPRTSKQYNAVSNFFHESTNISAVIETLREINHKHWNIPAQRFDEYVQGLQKLPKNTVLLMTQLTNDDAYQFAQTHHDGTVQGFLRTYRKAIHRTLEDVGESLIKPAKRVQQIELSSKDILLKYVLSPKNSWQLPVDGQHHIRADVIDYLQNFGKHALQQRKPESFWLTPEQALEQFAGIEVEAQGEAALHTLNEVISTAKRNAPGNPFLMVTLAGHDVLIRVHDGNAMLFEKDLGRWLEGVVKQNVSETFDMSTEQWQNRIQLEKLSTLRNSHSPDN